jgi:hypothetical protein
VWDVEGVEIAIANRIEVGMCCKEVSRKLLCHSGATFYYDATTDKLSLGSCNDAIVIVVEDTEGCHLPW